MRGARPGLQKAIQRIVARAIARELTAFVVPERRAALAAGLDLAAAGLIIAPTPRHASVLLVVGALPDGLAEAAAIALAQMPRPRLVLAVGASAPDALPADISVPLGQAGLEDGVRQARALLARSSWSPDAEIGSPPLDEQPQAGHDHAAMGHDAVGHDEHHGHETHCAAPGEDHSGHEGHDTASHEGHDHRAVSNDGLDHGAGHDAESYGDRAAMAHEDHHEADQVQPAHDHGAMAYEGMGHRAAQDEQAHDHADMGHDHAGNPPPQEPPKVHGEMWHGEMDHDAARDDEESHDHAAMDHSGMHHGMDHSGMDHGGGGFMSMVMMTKDLPRSQDGLPMEWVPAPFGPLFAGLPAGLTPTLTLDGDVVAVVSIAEMATRRGILDTLPGPAATLPDRLAVLEPLSPVSYRLLAQRALEAASGHQPDAATVRSRAGALEWERVANHLGWLASLGELLGLDWLSGRAAALRLAMARLPEGADATPLRDDVASFSGRIDRVPLLQRRLRGIGAIPAGTGVPMHGPVARAAGIATDARVGDPAYTSPPLTPIIRQGGDAWARLQVRLEEIARSLDLVAAAGTRVLPGVSIPSGVSGHGEAVVETPRGAASLAVHLHDGQIHHVELRTPSMDHVALVEHVAKGSELADALVGIASLDLSPWEVER